MSNDFTVVSFPRFSVDLSPSEAVLMAHVLAIYNGGAGEEYGLVDSGPERVTAMLTSYLQALPHEIKCAAFQEALKLPFTAYRPWLLDIY